MFFLDLLMNPWFLSVFFFSLSLLLLFLSLYLRFKNALLKEKLNYSEEKLQSFLRDEERISRNFESLSYRIIEENRKSFADMADKSLAAHIQGLSHGMELRDVNFKGLVEPLNQMLSSYENSVHEFAKDRERSFASLESRLKSLGEAQAELRKETYNLSTALSQPQVRGRWGEATLRRVLELSGLVKHCDFVEQSQVENEEGRFRPDMIVRLPAGGNIVIDAKLPLTAYLEALKMDREEDRKKAFQAHAKQVAEHIRLLSGKNYWQHFDLSPEFVILFIPGESFFSAALEARPSLLEEAIDKKILLATPFSLVAMLKTVAFVWRERESYENAQKIIDLSVKLHRRFIAFARHMQKLGHDLDKGLKSYNQMIASFESRLLPFLRNFEDLGLAGKERLSDLSFVEQGELRGIKDIAADNEKL